ncbi:uncharacterized protein EV422DRAFT_545900 [Fimicolochytrium jonesii]|uniref:uncharacterized protein n=1 Tax=Fimicolochytrium jonesii TaxID=1396493 RepID=UPI0022FED6F6|nr:uncharacterized protein EV422DRAFT_545900 [Fimicolochytrium jonesii]KAI8816403.1 hypothetical protein EV422DRAFT_545900 [Fimicolochytrium jonesii]
MWAWWGGTLGCGLGGGCSAREETVDLCTENRTTTSLLWWCRCGHFVRLQPRNRSSRVQPSFPLPRNLEHSSQFSSVGSGIT